MYSKWPGENNAENNGVITGKAGENKEVLSQEVAGATYNITEDDFKE